MNEVTFQIIKGLNTDCGHYVEEYYRVICNTLNIDVVCNDINEVLSPK